MFFLGQESESPADSVSVCQKVKLQAVHWGGPVVQLGSRKHRAEFLAARPADWPRRRVDCDFRNLYPALRSASACHSVAELLALRRAAVHPFVLPEVVEWRQARAMPKPRATRQLIAARQMPGFRLGWRERALFAPVQSP